MALNGTIGYVGRMSTKTFECALAQDYILICEAFREESEFSEHPNISKISAVLFHTEKGPTGFFKGHILHLFDLLQAEGNPFLECDAHSQQMCDVYCALLAEGKVLEELSFGCEGDLFHLDRLWISPGYRGKDLGLACCAALIALFSDLCDYAIMKPFPLQWEGKVEGNETRFTADQKKLVAYYEPLGFTAAPGENSDFYYRTLNGPILGFDRQSWKKVKKIALPSAPENSEVEW